MKRGKVELGVRFGCGGGIVFSGEVRFSLGGVIFERRFEGVRE